MYEVSSERGKNENDDENEFCKYFIIFFTLFIISSQKKPQKFLIVFLNVCCEYEKGINSFDSMAN